MPTYKIRELPVEPPHQPVDSGCRDPDHDPPRNMVFEPGVWRHVCPSCGHEQTFTVARPSW